MPRVLVRISDGRKLIVNGIQPHHTVQNLREMVRDVHDVAVGHQRQLLFQDRELEDHFKLEQSGVVHDTTVDMELSSEFQVTRMQATGGNSRSSMKVSVRSLVGETLTVDNAEPSDSFAILKSKIEAKSGIPALELQLKVDDDEPGDDLLNDCDIEDGDEIQYGLRSANYQVQVIGIQGDKTTIVLPRHSMVRELREKIAHTPGIAMAMEFQLLSFDDRQIESEDAKTMSAVGFRTDNVNLVTLTSSARGGPSIQSHHTLGVQPLAGESLTVDHAEPSDSSAILNSKIEGQSGSLLEANREIRKVRELLDTRILALEQNVRELNDEVLSLTTAHDEVRSRLTSVERSASNIQELVREEASRQFRTNNVVLFGVKELEGEDPAAHVKRILPGNISDCIRNVTRVGRMSVSDSQPNTRPRRIVVELTPHGKQELLALRETIHDDSGSRVHIAHDLTPAEQTRRRELLPKFKSLRDRGIKCKMPRDTIIIDGRVALQDDLERLLQ